MFLASSAKRKRSFGSLGSGVWGVLGVFAVAMAAVLHLQWHLLTRVAVIEWGGGGGLESGYGGLNWVASIVNRVRVRFVLWNDGPRAT